MAQKEQALSQHALQVLGKPIDVGRIDVGDAQALPRLGIRILGPRQKERRPARFVVRFFDEPSPVLGDESQLDARRADLRVVRHLIGRHEADAEAPDVVASRQLSAATHFHDAVVVAAVT